MEISFGKKSPSNNFLQFGKTGNPGIEDWKPLDWNNPVYLEIGEEHNVQQGLPMRTRIDFWNSLPPVYWRHTTPVKRFEPKPPKDEL